MALGKIKTRDGWADFGPVLSRHLQIPWGLTDRGTGTVYYLTAHSGPPERLALNTTHALPGTVVPKIYPAFDEPFVPGPEGTIIRIFVRDARLGFEEWNTNIHSGMRLLATHPTYWQTIRYEFVLPTGFFFSAVNDPNTTLDNPAFETDPYFGRLF